MRNARVFAAVASIVALVGFVGGCAKPPITYEPNVAVHNVPKFDKTLAIAEFKDVRPVWEKEGADRNETNDYRCADYVAPALTRAVKEDFAASNVFAEVALLGEGETASKADLILRGDVKRFYARFHANWMKFPAACALILGAPFYIPYEYADFEAGLHLKLVDAKTDRMVWERTLARRWTYGPMTAFTYGSGHDWLYGTLCEKVRNLVGRAIRDIDDTLAEQSKLAAEVKQPE